MTDCRVLIEFFCVWTMQHEDATKTAVSTYLIDQGDGQVAYGTYRVGGGGVGGVSSVGPSPGSVGQGHVVGTLQRPPKTVNFDMGDDNYIDTLRRNAFSPGTCFCYLTRVIGEILSI